MNLSMTSTVDLTHTLCDLSFTKGCMTPLKENDVLMCLWDGKLYVCVVGSDHGEAMVHTNGSNSEVELMWTRPLGTAGSRFTTNYTVPGAAPGTNGESSLVDRATVHPIPAATYDESSEVITLPFTLPAVLRNFLRVSKLQSKGYPDYTKWNDAWKWEVNKILAAGAEEARLRCEARGVSTAALFLDGPAAITSSVMMKYTAYTTDALFAPNCDWGVCREITSATGVYSPHSTLEKFLEYDNLPAFSYVWVDAMGNWDGNVSKGHCVRHAMRSLFVQELLAPVAYLAYTVNIRGRPGIQSVRAREDMTLHMTSIRRWAKAAGYVLDSKPRLFHNAGGKGSAIGVGNMMTVSFTVKKLRK